MATRYAIAAVLSIAAITQPLFADDKDQVQAAVKAGQKYLIASQLAGGGPGIGGMAVMAIGGNGRGSECLTGLALIESGLPSDDPVVANIARNVRQSLMSSNSTYEISLMIMFLDRVGQKADQPLIQFLTLRLMSGQGNEGSWSYSCNLPLNEIEGRVLLAELLKDAKLVTPDKPKTPKKETKPREDDLDKPTTPKKDKPEVKPEPPREDPKPKLHQALEPFAQAIRRGVGGGIQFHMGGDHSNTQFATVGLWCGRRHGVDVSDSLVALDKHYRASQGADGGWAYSVVGGGASSPAMTCAGLMGLAMGFGAKNLDDKIGRRADPDEIAKDKSVEAGLKYVGDFIAAAGARRVPGGPGVFEPNGLSSNLYFMWSLERVGMVYGLTTIGRVDWYEWGSKVLVASQQRDGSWRSDGFHGGSAENSTAFALLFLTKANLAEDLATSLKGKVKDPGSSRLRSPGDLNKLLEGAGKGSSGPKDPGTTTPRKGDNPGITDTDKAGKLAAALVAAEGAERADLLKKYQETKGGEYTDALARAAAKMTGEALTQTREALSQRLTRMTAVTLIDLMRDRDRELRRAAALAAGAKGKDRLSEFAPSLIRLVADDEAIVAQAARATLKSLTGEDFGPEAGAGPADRGKALIAWRNWWDKRK